jgi:hypothetical protein
MALASRIMVSKTLCNLLRASSRPLAQRALSSLSPWSERSQVRGPAVSNINVVSVRSYGQWGPDSTPVDINDVTRRVLKVASGYDKIDSSRVS